MIAAQRDAYLQTLDTTVLSCSPSDGGFAVRLSDTVLYPEGGGQPADRGMIGAATVLDVQRSGEGVVHTVDTAVEQGAVEVRVDWSRRYDFMQQHSAQHLVTAIAADEFGLETVSFHLGDDYSAIELVGLARPEMWAALEDRVCEEVCAARAILQRVVSVEEYGAVGVRSRGLPDGHVGDVRLVEIDGIDLNTCGGTHVANTAELQMVRFTKVEKTTKGVRLHYLAGGRVLNALRAQSQRDARIGELLSCPPDDFATSLEKLQRELKVASAELRANRGELASAIAASVVRQGPVMLRRLEADLAFFNAIANELPDRLLVIVGDGVFLVAGPEGQVAAVGPAVRDALGGRGGGRGDRFQGKFESGNATAAFEAARQAIE